MFVFQKIWHALFSWNTRFEIRPFTLLPTKYEHLTGEEILPSNQSRIIEQVKFTYSLLGKAFEKQIETIEEQGITQVEALKALKLEKNKDDIKSIEGIFPKDIRTNEIKNEIYDIKKWEEKIKRED